MWIVRLALRRPYTVAVMSLLILVMGVLSLSRMIVDIFPVIDIPVVIVVWNYPGLSPEDMERRVVIIAERAYSTTVNGIQRIESQSIPGIGMLKVYFSSRNGNRSGDLADLLRFRDDIAHRPSRDATAGHCAVQRLQYTGSAVDGIQQDPF